MVDKKIYVNLNLNKNEIKNALFQVLSEAPENPSEGQYYYDSTLKSLRYFDGTEWTNVGSEMYTSPEGEESIALGGIASGSTFSNKTATEMFNALLFPERFPTLSNPYASFSKSLSATYYEIGSTLNITFTSTFNRGSISPAYGTNGYRSGLPTKYTYSGSQLPLEVESSELSNIQQVSDYTIIQGNQTWSSQVSYLGGEQPKSNRNNNYEQPLPSGQTNQINLTITGVYPWYATTSTISETTKQSLTSMTSTYVEANLVSETELEKQKLDFPLAWKSITGFQFFSTVSNTWEWIGGTKASSLNMFNVTDITKNIQGVDVDYKRYINNSAQVGSRRIRAYTN